MIKRFRSAVLALIATAGLITGVTLMAPAAQAVTWTNLGLLTDTTYVDDCSGSAGAIRVELEWQLSSDSKLRLSASRDIKIVNNSDADLQIEAGNSQLQGSVTYIRLQGTPRISTYTNSFTVQAHTTSVMSADNPARWVRMDGVADSDPSPAGTAISTGSDPAIEMFGRMHTAGGYCGVGDGFYTEIANNAA
jgi:hypothetical protein